MTFYHSKNGVTISGNNATADVDFDITKPEYTFMGTVGWVINSGLTVGAVSCYPLSATSVRVRLMNHGLETVTTGSIYIYCLYLKK